MTDSAFRSRASKRWGAFMDFANQHSGAEWMFRGVGDRQQHLLVPKIGRPAPPDLPDATPADYSPTRERAIFKTFKRRAGLHLDRRPDNDFGWLALAQHHGLPTRLLDWSSNPLVAAYFAVSSAGCAVARVYAIPASELSLIDASDPAALDPFDDISDVCFVIPGAQIRRIAHQQGFFTIHPRPEEPWQPYGAGRTAEAHVFDIEVDVRLLFERRLFALGITAAGIMDDLDGLARTLAWQYRTATAVGALSY